MKGAGLEPPERNRPGLRLRVKRSAESVIRSGHPWVFDESILELSRPGEAGELAVVYDRHNRFLAIGLYDPESPLRVRVLHQGKPREIGAAWWEEKLVSALERRASVADPTTTGYRCIHGESDGWPGLVLDRYAETLVLKLYTAAWLPRLDDICDLIERRMRPERIVLRLSRNLQKSARETHGVRDGTVIRGKNLSGPVIFLESGLKFEADVLKGQKTGFFLDQRENRRRVGELAHDRTVLNTFSFSGGFSLYAAQGGARAATDLDISPHALESAKRNFGLNADIPEARACVHKTVQGDVFEWLASNLERQFDLVILDPPALAKRAGERAGALRAYSSLVALALKHLNHRGILVACSCSAQVPSESFFLTVEKSAAASGRKFQEIARSFHAPDHPATFKEARYLKAVFLRFD